MMPYLATVAAVALVAGLALRRVVRWLAPLDPQGYETRFGRFPENERRALVARYDRRAA